MAEVNADIRIISIRQTEFSFRDMPEEFVEQFSAEKCGINFMCLLRHNLEKEQFVIGCNFEYVYQGEQGQERLLTFNSENTFKISPLKDYLQIISDKEFKLPDFIMVPILSTSIGSARGMLITKTAGTYLSNIILPIVNMEFLLKHLRPEQPNQSADSSLKHSS